jgi:hypothetical protein
VQLDLVGPARQLYDLLSPYSNQVPMMGMPLEPVALFVGRLANVIGHDEESERYLTMASAMNQVGGLKFSEARTLIALAHLRISRGTRSDLRDARELFERAGLLASANGYAGVERRASAELSQLKP